VWRILQQITLHGDIYPQLVFKVVMEFFVSLTRIICDCTLIADSLHHWDVYIW